MSKDELGRPLITVRIQPHILMRGCEHSLKLVQFLLERRALSRCVSGDEAPQNSIL